VKTFVLVVVAALAASSCIVRTAPSRRLTGTCEGACAHYLDCKGARGGATEQSCVVDCRQVFADDESLRAFESLSCEDAVEYVDGPSHAVTSSP
jgi:hypothetical protein